jgi:hypothetical protein
MNLLFQNNQFKSSLRSYKQPPKNKKPRVPKKNKKAAPVLNSVEESNEVIDLNDKRFDLSQIPEFIKKGQGESTSKGDYLVNIRCK